MILSNILEGKMREETAKHLVRADQVRAARALLGWNQSKLAREANVSRETIADFESGKRTPIGNNMVAIIRAIEDAGVAFFGNDDRGGPGVRWFLGFRVSAG
jgi:transcriptional regulator with XRE-family HTH domain